MTAPTYTLTASNYVQESVGTFDSNTSGSVADFVFDTPEITLTDNGGVFTAAMVGRQITIANSTTAGNNGTFTILSFIDVNNITYDNLSGKTESGKGAGATTLVVANATTTLTNEGGLFSPTMVGKTLVVSNATTAGNNGTFVVVTVPDANTVTYVNAAGKTEAGKGSSATLVKVSNVIMNEPFTLNLLVDGTSATYNVEVHEMSPVIPKNFAVGTLNVQGSTAGGGMKQVTTGFSDPATNINVPAPVTVLQGATANFAITVVPLFKSDVVTSYKLSLLPKIKNVTSGLFEAVAPTQINLLF